LAHGGNEAALIPFAIAQISGADFKQAGVAEAAATNLVTLSALAQNHWPEGSDSFSIDGTRALPAIWEDMADFEQKWAAFGSQAAALADAAPNGAEGLGAAVGALGQTCQSCHEAYREPNS
jgi:cytochrome c556